MIAGTGSNHQHVIDTANRYEDLGCVAQLVNTLQQNLSEGCTAIS